MKDRGTIMRLIAKAKREKEELQRRVNSLTEVIGFLSQQLNTDTTTIRKRVPEVVNSSSNRFEKMNAPEAAEIVLRENGKPMHLNEVVTQLFAGGYKEQTDPKKLYGNLYTRLSRKKSVFKRIAGKRATFGLVDEGQPESSI
jgi:hypothetical protein